MGITGSLTGNLYVKLPDGTTHKVLNISCDKFTHTPLSLFVNYKRSNYITVDLPDNYFEYEEGEI